MEYSLKLKRRTRIFRYVSRQFAALTPPTGRAFARRAVALASASRRFGAPSGGKFLTESSEARPPQKMDGVRRALWRDSQGRGCARPAIEV